MAKVNPVEVQKFLNDVDYPISKDDLLEKAESEGADEGIISTIREAPMDEFNSPSDLSEAIGMEE